MHSQHNDNFLLPPKPQHFVILQKEKTLLRLKTKYAYSGSNPSIISTFCSSNLSVIQLICIVIWYSAFTATPAIYTMCVSCRYKFKKHHFNFLLSQNDNLDTMVHLFFILWASFWRLRHNTVRKTLNIFKNHIHYFNVIVIDVNTYPLIIIQCLFKHGHYITVV